MRLRVQRRGAGGGRPVKRAPAGATRPPRPPPPDIYETFNYTIFPIAPVTDAKGVLIPHLWRRPRLSERTKLAVPFKETEPRWAGGVCWAADWLPRRQTLSEWQILTAEREVFSVTE